MAPVSKSAKESTQNTQPPMPLVSGDLSPVLHIPRMIIERMVAHDTAVDLHLTFEETKARKKVKGLRQ